MSLSFPLSSSSSATPRQPPLLTQKALLTPLGYSIHDYSSFSSIYHPKNVLVDNPNDQNSRWSTTSNNQSQYLTLKLDRVAVLGTITFGKYHKGHICNLKEFRVFCGPTLESLVEVLVSGLRNDEEPEVFPVRHRLLGPDQDVYLPCRFVKVVPLAAWGASFNFSIWFIRLIGIVEPSFVEKAIEGYSLYRERQAIALCLKHFRQRNLLEPFVALAKRNPFPFEHPLLTKLHEDLVVRGDFDLSEQLLEHAATQNLFDEYIRTFPCKPVWTRIEKIVQPSMRGGHQMCLDVEEQKLYLFGGWDGAKDLADFWVYDVAGYEWRRLSLDTSLEGGPPPRSCHKMCLDQTNRQLYVLGGYVDTDLRTVTHSSADFYRYDLEAKTWTVITRHTLEDGGPESLYDHQMVIDSDNQIIYVFGGRTATSVGNPENNCSGLYSFDLRTGVWRLIRSDTSQSPDGIKLRGRHGHSMLFDERLRCLYIFAGQRGKEYLSDFYVYDVDSDTVIDAVRDCSKIGGPDVGYTQRATLDLELDELYVLSGLVREKVASDESAKNCFWKYDLLTEKWTKIYQNENTDPAYWAQMARIEPCPRFAHHMVYDPKNKIHYLFGGNPGDPDSPSLRLDDFWMLRLSRPARGDVLRKLRLQIKQLRFREMCGTPGNAVEALKYLQTEVSRSVDHEDESESAAFRALASTIFQQKVLTPEEHFEQRSAVFDKLLEFFPPWLKEPKTNLVDLV